MAIQIKQLETGQEVWGYIGNPVTVCGTEYQEYGEVRRLSDGRYRARIAGRHDNTGLEDYYSKPQEAWAAARLLNFADCEIEEMSPKIFRIVTPFDRRHPSNLAAQNQDA